MNPTSSRPVQTIIFVLIAAGLIALALGGYLAPLSRFVLDPIVSAQAWITTRYQTIQDYVNAPQDMARLQARNVQLEQENSELKGQIIELQQQLSQTSILSALLNFARANPDNQYRAAQVIGFDTSPFLSYVIINLGSDDGIRRGMPVVTNQGLVGRVEAVNSSAAKVQLITDSASKVNVRLQPSNTQAVLLGSLTGDISLDMIPQNAQVQVGDLVLTSGLGGSYPPNILVGQVTGVRRREQDLFQKASVQSAVDFSRLEIVLVIINFKPVNLENIVPTPGAP
jgi:rod shape-determining protein MreC